MVAARTEILGYSVVLEPGFTVQGGVGLGARREANSYDVGALLGPVGEASTTRVHASSWRLTQRIVVNLGWAF